MRIAVSCIMDVAKSGAWQVTRNILMNLMEADKSNEYIIYAEKTYNNDFGTLPPNFRVVKSSITAGQPVLNIFWHALILPFLLLRDKADVLYLPWHSAALVIKTRPVVLTIHDLTEYRLPGHYSRSRMIYRKLMLPLSSRLADKIVAVSNYTKEDIMKFLRVPADKIEVVYNAVTVSQAGKGPSRIPQPYLLYVGQIQHPNKNLLRLLRAFKKIKLNFKIKHKLVLAGKDHLSAGVIHQEVKDLNLEDQVIFPGYIPDRDLPALYRSADLFIYPSLFEGFGIPPLEAMAYGCPVIVSNTASLPEIVADAGLLASPDDTRELAKAIMLVLNNSGIRDELVAKGFARAKEFSWKDSADKMRLIFESAGKPRKARARKLTGILILALIFSNLGGHLALAKDAVIDVYCKSALGKVNPEVFGNNLLGYDPLSYEVVKPDTLPYYGFSDYGAGLWDPGKNIPVREVVDLAKATGMAVARFPGGCGSHHYNWKEAIGKKREHFLFGIDEFLKTCEAIGASPLITLSYFTGNEQDAADLVEYLNSPNDGSNPGGGIDWALERANNGHPRPYNVKYFEVGNEVWHGDHRKIKNVPARDYAQSYLKYYGAMKAIDSYVQVGAVLFTPGWNKKVLETIKDKIDFGILHVYPTPVWGEGLADYPVDEIFRISLALPAQECERDFLRLQSLAKKIIGRGIPLAISEYNAGFVQDKPVPYRFSLGAALVNAELLRIFLQPRNNILLATHWNFLNEYWGMLVNGFDATPSSLYNGYYKRPDYYVFSLYQAHFGVVLLDSKIESDTYLNSMRAVPYLSLSASKNASGDKVCLMVINRDLKNRLSANIALHDFSRVSAVDAWVLNGPSIDASNELDHDRVGVRKSSLVLDKKLPDNNFKFTFEPHSLTAIEIEGTKQ